MAKARTADFKTPICRLSYAASLFKARAQAEGQAEKFSCTLIFLKADRAVLEAHVLETIKAEWGDKGLQMVKAGLIKNPFLAGDGKEAHNKKTGDLHGGMGPDVFFIRPSANKDRPPFVIWKDPNVQESEATVYSGCYGKAVLNCFAWTNAQSGNGVSFGIQGFQKHREGDRLGGARADPSEWAETIEDEGDAPESTRTGAGAAGLFGS
jgi:hypothetical protein